MNYLLKKKQWAGVIWFKKKRCLKSIQLINHILKLNTWKQLKLNFV